MRDLTFDLRRSRSPRLSQLWDLASGEADALRARARGRVATGGYSWEQVVAAYEAALRWDDETPS